MQRNRECDVEKGGYQAEYLEGYPSLAAFIASDKELAVYRAFDRLNARNLLYAQSELLYLEEKLDALDRADSEAEPGSALRSSARSWEVLQRKANGHDEERLKCVLRLREAIKEYSEQYQEQRKLKNISVADELDDMLLNQSQILNLERPHRRVSMVMRKWFFRYKAPALSGPEEELFDNLHDLVALRPARDRDRLSLFLRRFGYFFRHRDRHDIPESWADFRYFPESRVARTVNIISTLVAGGLLVGAIVTLSYVQPLHIRLGLVCVFAFMFAASLALLTNSTQAEVFGASAA
jgi:hypothetical protein